MLENLRNCTNCNLCHNQAPLLDKSYSNACIIWVGLSAKIVKDIVNERPLENNTNTGKIIERIEANHDCFYKTNLVKCAPLDENSKLRYPNKDEMNFCFENLLFELITIKPKIVFLLGSKVANFVLNKLKSKKFKKETNQEILDILKNIEFHNIYHPSYIAVYKRKEEDKYVEKVQTIISSKVTSFNVY